MSCKYAIAEMLDQAARIATRFHSNCPQTGRKYYHPPSETSDHQSHGGAASGVGGNGSTRVLSCGRKAGGTAESFDVILFSV